MRRSASHMKSLFSVSGGNDIDATDGHPLTVGMDVFQLASKLNNNIHGLRRADFCLVVGRKRWRNLSVEGVGPRCRT